MNDDEADPALQFFAEGEVDLYGALGLDTQATEEQIKKAYRKAALLHHPDKQRGDEASKATAAAKFQQIGFAYAVLSAPARRTRYDATGRTGESMFGGTGDDGEPMDWNAYFSELWTGEVNASTLDDFKDKYQGSEDERSDVISAYEATKGHLRDMVDHVPFMSLRTDRTRVEEIVEQAISAKTVKRTRQWDTTRKDSTALRAAEKKETAEEHEAHEMAREMGVYDALFGDEAAKAKARAGGKGKAKAVAATTTKRKKGGEEEDDVAGLQMLIAKRSQARSNNLDNLIAKLEHNAAAPRSSNKKAKKAAPLPPSDEEFAQIQAKMDAKRSTKTKKK